VKIMGLQKLTLLDYPGKMACTVFTGGCNFRCPFCHNASLVVGDMSNQDITEDEFFAFLDKRVNILDGVCITGGEPTLQKDLEEFIRKIKSKGFLVKLDTNGYRPDVLKRLVNEKLIDYVAMDIKNSPKMYAATVGIQDIDMSLINESMEFLKKGNVDYEFRTTIVNGLHDSDSIQDMVLWIAGEEKYYLQGFVDSGDILGVGYAGYDREKMSEFLEIARKYVPKAELRGI